MNKRIWKEKKMMDGQTQVGVMKSLFFVTANALGYF